MIQRPKTLLIVDDDPDFRNLLHVLLTRNGLNMEEAANCRDAIHMLESHSDRIDAVLLDYYMPGMPAGACVRRLKAICQEKIPIVLVTAAVDASARAQELELIHYLSKPFDVEKLMGLLDIVLDPDRVRRSHEACNRTARVD